VFYYKTELSKQLGQYIVATEKVTNQDVNRLVLWDKEIIVDKKMMEIGIFRFFRRFSRMEMNGER